MKKLLALVLALVMTLGLATVGANAKTEYSDAKDINYGEAVDVMTAIGILGGDADGFRPGDNLKRSEGAKIITYLMLGPTAAEQIKGGSKYSDVPASHWAAGYIEYLTVEGVVGGVGKGRFDPDGTLTVAAFAKMLLGALGYDADIEGLGGYDWMINVQHLAKKVNLFDGNKNVVASADIKREEAALYAFNMIQKPLVEYANKGSSLSVNGADIKFGASNATYVTNTSAGVGNYANISDEVFNVANVGARLIIEFAEQYFTGLKKQSPTDAFGREATKWVLDGKEIGTYSKTTELIYTSTVTLGQIYKDLGLTQDTYVAQNTNNRQILTVEGNNDSYFYIDGIPSNAAGGPAVAGDTALLLKKESSTTIGGKGTETQVFYKDNGRVIIAVINWYVGDVVGVYGETAKKAAYIDIAGRGVEVENGTIAQNANAVTNKNTSGSKTTTGYKQDDIVLYTASWKDKINGVQDTPSIETVEPATVVEGELNSFVTLGRESLANRYAAGSVTIAGKKYDYSAKVANTPDGTFLRDGIKLKVVLDKYGYAIDVGDYGVQNYAVVVKKGVSGSFGTDPVVNLLLTDGTTTGAVVLTTSNGAHSVTGNTIFYSNGTTQVREGDIVTYTKAADGEYRLTFKSAATNYATTAAEVAANTKLITNGDYKLYSLAYGTGNAGRANGKTVFLIKDSSGNYKVYNGIKEVPSVIIMKIGAVVVNSYAEKSTSAQIVYIDLNGDVASMLSTDTIFVKFGATTGHTINSNGETAYEVQAWVNGEEQTIRINSAQGAQWVNGTTHYKMFGSMTLNKNGIATLGDEKTPVYGSVALKNSNIGLGGVTYSVANPCKVFEVKDNEILASSINAIPTSDTTKLWFNQDNSLSVTYVFWTRDAVKVYSSSDYTTYVNNAGSVSGAIAAMLAEIKTGETAYVSQAGATTVADGAINVPAGKRLVFNGDLILDGTNTSVIAGALEAKSLKVGNNTGAAASTVMQVTGSGSSVIVKNQIEINADGHVDVTNNGALTAWNESGTANIINGSSLEMSGSNPNVNLVGNTNLYGLLKILAGMFTLGGNLNINNDENTTQDAQIQIGTLNGTTKIVVEIKGAVTTKSATVYTAIIIRSTGDRENAGSVKFSSIALAQGIDVTILKNYNDSKDDPIVNLGNVTGSGKVDNDSSKTEANSIVGVEVVGEKKEILPQGTLNVEINMSRAFFNGDKGTITAAAVNTADGTSNSLAVQIADAYASNYTGAAREVAYIYRAAGDTIIYKLKLTATTKDLFPTKTVDGVTTNLAPNYSVSPVGNNAIVVDVTNGSSPTEKIIWVKHLVDRSELNPEYQVQE